MAALEWNPGRLSGVEVFTLWFPEFEGGPEDLGIGWNMGIGGIWAIAIY